VPLLYLVARINGDAAILGDRRGGVLSRMLVWTTFGVMALSSVALIWTMVAPH
jgi:hypothetical protein